MFRVSTLSLIAIIAIASLSWVLNGGSLEGTRHAGWTDLSTWGWGERGLDGRSPSIKSAAAAPADKNGGSSKHAKDGPAAKVGSKDTAKDADWDVAQQKSKGAEVDIKLPGGKSADKSAAKSAGDTDSKGVPHGQPWPIATEVPDWSAVMKVTGALPAVDWVFDTPAAEATAAAGDDRSSVSDSVENPWPVATDVPNWSIDMPVTGNLPKIDWSIFDTPVTLAASDIVWPVATEVRDWVKDMPVTGALPEVDWSQFPETVVTAQAEVPEAATEVVIESKGVAHPFPWPIADEVPNWNIVLPDTTALEATMPEAAEPEAALAVGVPHPFPWPIATEVPKWDMPLKMTAVIEPPPPAPANVTEPGMPWPIATEVPKWPGPRQPAPVTEVARRAELTTEQIACEDELRRIYKSGTILFKSDSAEIEKSSSATLDKLAKAAKECEGVRIRVEGHTDSQGRTSYNQQLSERRAKAIISYLTGAGVNGGNMSAYGYGAERPVASNDTEPNRQKNRRIEFTVY
ncbi:MAG: OmpA family protein [Hyphomicrobium sp.]